MKIHTPSHRRTRRVHLRVDDEAERLVALAEALERSLAADLDHPPTLVAATIEPDGATLEILLEPLAHHPAVELEGFVAPPSWWCLGIVAGGRARSIPEEDPLRELEPSHPREPVPYAIHLAHLVARSGTTARTLRDRRTDETLTHCAEGDRVDGAVPDPPGDGGGTDPTPRDDRDDRDGGLVDEYLRLALRLATPPPARDTTELFAALWVHRIMSEAALHRLLDASWARVAGLHPLFDLQPDHDPAVRDWALAHLDRAGELMPQAHPWARVRAACGEGIGPFTGRPAELAGWLDDGAFARLVHSGLGPIEDLLADLHHLIPNDAHDRVLDTVEGWGLLREAPR